MSSNINVTPGTGAVVSTDEITTLNGGAVAAQQTQRVKVTFGAAGSGTDVQASAPLPVTSVVTSLPALATGANVIGGVAQSGTWNVGLTGSAAVSTINGVAQAYGTGVRGATVQRVTIATDDVVPASQSGTWNITNVSGTISLPTGAATSANQSTLNTNIGSSADGILTAGAAGSLSSYMRTVMEVGLSTASSSVKIDQTTDGTTNLVRASPATTAHALIPAPSTYRLLSAAATTNAANIKASAGTVKGIQGFNAKASAVYLKLYNKASSPTVGTDTPVKTIYLPASAAFAFDFGTGVAFATGISIALTGAGADADTTALVAADILALNVDYH